MKDIFPVPDLHRKEGIEDNPVYSRNANFSIRMLRESLKKEIDGEYLKLLSGWELVGDVLVIELSEKLDEKGHLIGERILELHPRARAVLKRKGIYDVFREPKVELIAGKKTETVHKENGCYFKIDPAKVMFSFGNQGERKRMSQVSNAKEVVLDMFAGIGQFTIPIAKYSKPKKVYAIEKNPVAFGYLEENIRINKLKNVTAIEGDCREVIHDKIANRVIMGYLFETFKYLPTAVQALTEDGGTIHYHFLSTKGEIQFKEAEVKKIAERYNYKAEILCTRKVKSYAPKVYHFVFDIMLKNEDEVNERDRRTC
jgi:tRNA wybutosine-synthesizing protein 2